MNEFYVQIVVAFLGVVALTLVPFLFGKLREVSHTIENEKVLEYTNEIIDIAERVVVALNQTVVDDLKEKNEFSEDMAVRVFNEAKQKILKIMSKDGLKLLDNAYDDFSSYLDAIIEHAVSENKK